MLPETSHRVHSFDPLSAADARLLILGSMPGKASLRAGQYYAHPRNAYWQIIQALFGIAADLPYQQRCTRLVEQKIALWDVLKTCRRSTSLDSDIVESSIIANEFPVFFAAHPQIETVYFNGAMAEKSFERYVVPSLRGAAAVIPRVRLPSTSPANASMSFAQKLIHWKKIVRGQVRGEAQ